ncbi:outer membrane protein N [Vibrio ponticus]|nr:outer membrane protein N [Vibrio ponticus]
MGWQGKQTIVDKEIEYDNGGVLQEVTTTTDFDERMQIAVSGEFAGATVGYVFSGGDVGTKEAESHVVSASFGNYGKGLYVALVYGDNENFYSAFNQDLEDSKQYEAIAAFGLDNGVNVILNYEAVEDDELNKTLFSETALQVEYTVTSGLVAFAGYQFDLGDDFGTKENDQYTVGARYFF